MTKRISNKKLVIDVKKKKNLIIKITDQIQEMTKEKKYFEDNFK